MGLSMGASYGLQQALSPKPKTQVQQAQIAPRDANPVRSRCYGRMKMAGPTVFFEANGGFAAYELTVHCEGPIDAYEEWWANDAKTAIASESLGGSVGIYPYLLNVAFESSLGGTGQAANAHLMSVFPVHWTADHKLSGLAWTLNYAVLPPKPWKTFQDVYPNGRPNCRVVARLTRVLDIRTSVTAWSRNPALCIRDFLTRARTNQITGQSWRYIHPSKIDTDSFIAAANFCDQNIALAAGGTEKRYSLDGLYDVSTPPRETVRRMLAACDGELVLGTNGLVGLRVAVKEVSAVTLTEDDLLDFTYQQGSGKLAAYNRLEWRFTDERNDYQVIQGDPWENDAEQAEIGEVRTKSIDLEWVHSHSQGRRICKILMSKDNPRHILSNVVTNMKGLRCYGQNVVRVKLTYPEVDSDFYIRRFVPSDDLKTVTMDLVSADWTAYDWDAALEEGTPPPAPAPGTPGVIVNTPTGVSLSVVRSLGSDGVYVVRIRATVTPLTSTLDGVSTAGQHTLLGRIRLNSGTDADYVPMMIDGDNAVISDFVDDGQTYRVQVAWRGLLGAESAWSAAQTIVATADPVPPSPPPLGSFNVTHPSPRRALLTWKNSSSLNLRRVGVYRSLTADFADAIKIAEVNGGPSVNLEYEDTGLTATTYRYWLTGINGSGVESTARTGPRAIVITDLYFDFANNVLPLAITTNRNSLGYADGTLGAWSSFAIDTMRRTNRGLFHETATTNLIRNSASQGAAAPSTAPTNWAISGLTAPVNGISASIVGTGVENGVDYTEIRWQGTATTGFSLTVVPEATVGLVAIPGEVYSGSAFVRQTAGTLTGISTLRQRLRDANAAGSAFGGAGDTVSVITVSSAGLGTQRKMLTRTMGTGTERVAFLAFELALTSGGVIDVTFRFGWPQLEKRSEASSPMRTTTATATRNAEAQTMTLPSGISAVLYTFDDNTTEVRSAAPGSYSIPTNLNRAIIKTADFT